MKTYHPIFFGVVFLAVLVGCERADRRVGSDEQQRREPRQVAVQHVLISFDGSPLNKPIGRTEEEAEELAKKILEVAKAGEDFSKLVEKYSEDYEEENADSSEADSNEPKKPVNKLKSDDSTEQAKAETKGPNSSEAEEQHGGRAKLDLYRLPGVYRLANVGERTIKSPLKHLSVYPRKKFVPQFGDVAFGLEIGEIGMTQLDPETSPYGWHIIKRID